MRNLVATPNATQFFSRT